MILENGLVLEGTIRFGDFVRIDQFWSAYVCNTLYENWTCIGHGIFIQVTPSPDSHSSGLFDDKVVVMMSRGLSWFDPQRLRLTAVSHMDD